MAGVVVQQPGSQLVQVSCRGWIWIINLWSATFSSSPWYNTWGALIDFTWIQNYCTVTHTYGQSTWVAGLVYQSLAGAAPAYLADDCCLLSDAGHRPLRSNSNDIRKLFVPRTHNKLGDRSFSAAGPRLWNELPPGLRRPGLTFDSFRKSLKTHLFGDRSA